jgi:hypothetical protein
MPVRRVYGSCFRASPCHRRRYSGEGIEVLRSAPQCPRMNAFAERWVRTVRGMYRSDAAAGQRHLERVVGEYAEHYNKHRAHRALELRAPAGTLNGSPFPAARITRRPVLGGLIIEYEARRMTLRCAETNAQFEAILGNETCRAGGAA